MIDEEYLNWIEDYTKKHRTILFDPFTLVLDSFSKDESDYSRSMKLVELYYELDKLASENGIDRNIKDVLFPTYSYSFRLNNEIYEISEENKLIFSYVVKRLGREQTMLKEDEILDVRKLVLKK